MIKPYNFDGAKFAKKYNLDPLKDYWDDGNGNIVCPSLPNLTDSDLLDCVTVWAPPTVHEFDLPVKAPDFLVATPKINPDPELVDEAIAEMKKGEGSEKSIALIVLSMAKYLEMKRSKLR